jgi:hypothetical protein
VVTRDGETVAGRLDTETATSIEILDTAGQKHAIQRKDIQSIEPSNQSIMPGGFEQLPAGTLIGHDGDEPVLAPHDPTVLIMPSRRLWPGKTAVRLAYPVPG